MALPALAAAVQASATARKRARAALMSTTRPARFEHEDTPLS